MFGINKRVLLAAGLLATSVFGQPVNRNLSSYTDYIDNVKKVVQSIDQLRSMQPIDFINNGLEESLSRSVPASFTLLENQEIARGSIDLAVCDFGYEATARSVKVYDLPNKIEILDIPVPQVSLENILSGEVELRTIAKAKLLPTKSTAVLTAEGSCGDARPTATGNLETYLTADLDITLVATIQVCKNGIDVQISIPEVDIIDPEMSRTDLSTDFSCRYKWSDPITAIACKAAETAFNIVEDDIEEGVERLIVQEIDEIADDLEQPMAEALEDMANDYLGGSPGKCD